MGASASTIAKPIQQVRLELNAVPEAVLQAADVIQGIARKLHLDRPTTRKLVQAVCEVMLNACTYAYPNDTGKVVLDVAHDDGCLRITVADFGRGFRCEDYYRPDGSRGPRAFPHSGLFIAAEAVDRLQIESGVHGTTVWMEKKTGQ